MHVSKWFSGAGLVVLAVAVIVVTVFSDMLFKGARVDLTEGKLYTLSEGSRNIVRKLDEPLDLYFFFSDSTSSESLGVRSYAKQVRELLEEFAQASDGKIKLTVIDPEPFSEDEDRAAEFGLQSVPINNVDSIYFGLVAQYGQVDDEATPEENSRPSLQIPFFQAERQQYLEYDIAKMIYQVSQKKQPTVGMIAGLQVNGGVDMMMRQPLNPWLTIAQIQQLFEVQEIEAGAQDISVDDYNLLLVIHPKDLSEESLFAIDQYVLKGGHAVFFVDPVAEQDTMSMEKASQDLNKLFNAWGVDVAMNQFIGDAQLALQVGGQNRQPVRHLGILQLTDQNLARDPIMTGQLETLHLSTAGAIRKLDEATTDVLPLMTSSEFAMPIAAEKMATLEDPRTLQDGFEPDGRIYDFAVQITGRVKSAFPDGVPVSEGAEEGEDKPDAAGDEMADTADSDSDQETEESAEPMEYLKESADSINVVIVADTDVLSDRLWVQVQQMFGQQIASPFADNGNFFFNTVEFLAGSADLIGIRGHGRYFRPFTAVKSMQREAEARFQSVEEELQQRLQTIEQQLAELQGQQGNQNEITLTPEMEAQLMEFQQERIRIRKQLRDVQHQLNKDIEQLDFKLKVINIALVPFILTLIAVAVAFFRRRKKA